MAGSETQPSCFWTSHRIGITADWLRASAGYLAISTSSRLRPCVSGREGESCAGLVLSAAEADVNAHRSISPNTMSSEPRMAETSASMWPRFIQSMACRCGKPGARILQR